MIVKINNTERINKSLLEEGKVTVLNQKEHIDDILKMNRDMDKVRAEYRVKNYKSEQSAKQTFFNS